MGYAEIRVDWTLPPWRIEGEHVVGDTTTPLPHPLRFERMPYTVWRVHMPSVEEGETVRMTIRTTDGQTVSPATEPIDVVVVPEPGMALMLVVAAVCTRIAQGRRDWEYRHRNRESTAASRRRTTTAGKRRRRPR